MSEIIPIIILLSGSLLDYLIGDPREWLHPVQIMGWLITKFTQWVTTTWKNTRVRKVAGVILGLGLIIASGGMTWLIIWLTNWLHPLLGIVTATILLASCFAGSSLRLATQDVLQPLESGDLIESRLRLSQYVGRDTKDLSRQEILRAILETVAENTTDGVTAPLFYATIGAFIPGVGSVPLAFAYKAASTLDSMIGYKKEPYRDLGWFNAQLEDYLTWLPCRCTVFTLALLSGQFQEVIRLCRRDANQDPSPNSGWSECAYAAVLKVQLGGKNSYGGVVEEKPFLGDDEEEITPEKIDQALQLMRSCFLVWLGLSLVILLGYL